MIRIVIACAAMAMAGSAFAQISAEFQNWAQGPVEAGARSILNPVSLVEVSAQARLIWLEEIADAERLEGAEGTPVAACVIADAVFV